VISDISVQIADIRCDTKQRLGWAPTCRLQRLQSRKNWLMP
jgi:hypothetical protein